MQKNMLSLVTKFFKCFYEVDVDKNLTLLNDVQQSILIKYCFKRIATALNYDCGYNEADGDFIFEEAMQKASNIGFFSPFSMARLSTDNFLRDHAVHAMANALLTPPKGSNEYLLYQLAGQGVLSIEDTDWFREKIR